MQNVYSIDETGFHHNTDLRAIFKALFTRWRQGSRRLLFLFSIFITHMLIIFHKVSANNTEIRKIRMWRLNITDLFTKQAKDKLDVNRLKWYLIGDKLYRRHVGFGARNAMFINHKKISEYAFLVSLIIICGDISVSPGPRIRNYRRICKKKCQRQPSRNLL